MWGPANNLPPECFARTLCGNGLGDGCDRSTLRSRKLRDFLEVAHENLIAALKVERILRDNRTILDQDPVLLADYLMGLDSFDIEDKAGEWSYLFDDAIEVSIAVRNEMQTLSRYDLPKHLD
jgi:hypothetical protein